MDSTSPIFGKIALSLSGGGYRAAAFHLGTLEMLYELRLLKDIKFLSTVSGGSIAGGFWAASVADGLDFDEYRQKLHQFLKSTNVVEEALKNLRTSRIANGVRSMPSLIRSAAGVYNAEYLLNGKTFAQLEGATKQFEEIVINTTEFRTGGSFRFIASTNPSVESGNNSLSIPERAMQNVRLADAVAASSCFPSGFEPMRFPSDFDWAGPSGLDDVKNELGPSFDRDVPLMDGGIFDNQGIDSIKNIYFRKTSGVDLFIISDTSARRSKSFEFPRFPGSGVAPLWTWCLVLILLCFGAALSALSIYVQGRTEWIAGDLGYVRLVFLFVLPFLFSVSVFGAICYGFLKLRALKKWVKTETGIDLWRALRSLRLPEIIHLAAGRLRSLIEMTTNVFMKRVRSLGFGSVFADIGMQEKLLPNLIYDIDNEERWGAEIRNAGLEPKAAIRARVVRAEQYQTNLWFQDPKDLDNLILCGRATVCFKVLKYLLRYKRNEIESPASDENKLYEQCVKHWRDALNADSQDTPFSQVNES